MRALQEVCLSDVADLSGGHAFKSEDYSSSGIFVLRTINIQDDYTVSRVGAAYIPNSITEKYERFLLKEFDTLFVMVGATLGKTGIVKRKDLPALLNQNMWVIRAFPEKINPLFLHYKFRELSQEVSGWVNGSARGFLRRDDVRNLKFLMPDMKAQHVIASILGALDDKIDLNRRTNETLEAMARALFRDWFVDFGPTRAKMAGEAPYLAPELWELFPDRLDDEGKPEGWKTEPLDEIATFLNGLALQKYPSTGDTSLPAIKIAQLRSENTETADPVSPDIPDDYIIEQNDLLFSWSGSLLCKFWNGQRGALNQHLFKVTSKRFEPWFIYEWIQFYMPEFQAIATAKATTMGHIQRRHLTESLVTIPPANIMQPANKAIGSLIEQIQSNNGQSRTLAQLRDLLLPKLMSGEISIRDAEKMVEDAT